MDLFNFVSSRLVMFCHLIVNYESSASRADGHSDEMFLKLDADEYIRCIEEEKEEEEEEECIG